MLFSKEHLFPPVQLLASHIENADDGRSSKVSISADASSRYVDIVAECDVRASALKSPTSAGQSMSEVTVNLYQLYVILEQCSDEIDLSLDENGSLVIRSYMDPKDETSFDMRVSLPRLQSFDQLPADITVGSIRLEPMHFTAIMKELYNFPGCNGVWFIKSDTGTYLQVSDRGVDIHLEVRGLSDMELSMESLYLPFDFIKMAFSVGGGVLLGALEIRVGSKTLSVITDRYELRMNRVIPAQVPQVDFVIPEHLCTVDSMTLSLELELTKSIHSHDSDAEFVIKGDSDKDVVKLIGENVSEEMPLGSELLIGGIVDEDFEMMYDPALLFELIKNPGPDVQYFKIGRIGDKMAIYYKSSLFLKKVIYDHGVWTASAPK
jgi:hypothetical protein